MASFLDGMAASIYAGFRGKLRAGVIRRMAGGTGSDGHGRPLGREPVLYAFEGFDDEYSDYTRTNAGIPRDSVRLNIFGASLIGIKPQLDDLARLDYPAIPGRAAYSQWFKLRERIATDPATALWQCEAGKVNPPS